MTGGPSTPPAWEALRRRALLVGGVAGALLLLGAAIDAVQFLRSYLPAFMFWLGLSLGCMAILMLHHVVGGLWGRVIRRPLEAAAATVPLMAVLFLPLLLGMRSLYPWAGPPAAAADEVLRAKGAYLNIPFFVGRAALYFAAWIALAHCLNAWSQAQEATGDGAMARRLQRLSGPGLIVCGLAVTFSAVDWMMSLEPHWSSTIYGMILMAGHALAGLAFVLAVAQRLGPEGQGPDGPAPGPFHDLGNLLLTLVMLWAYVSFAQFLIVWAENLAEEIPWYLRRTAGGWQAIALLLIALQFALPFVLLLFRATKRSPGALAGVAVLVLGVRLVELFWLIAPAFHPAALRVHWMDLVAPVALGGLWVAWFARNLTRRGRAPLPVPGRGGAPAQVGGG